MHSRNDTPNREVPTQTHTLEPLKPAKAMSLYLDSRSDELADRSLKLHEKHIQSFVDWCDENGIDNMNDVTARTVHEYQLSIKEGFKQSIYLGTIRQFVRFCEGIDAVVPDVSERIVLPDRERLEKVNTSDSLVP